MSVIATIEQEFQEVDDANDWQPRYLNFLLSLYKSKGNDIPRKLNRNELVE